MGKEGWPDNFDIFPKLTRATEFVRKLLNPYYPPIEHIPFEDPEPEIEPMAHDLFDPRPYEPPVYRPKVWDEYHGDVRTSETHTYYVGPPTTEMSLEDIARVGDDRYSPNGSQAVFNKDEFNRQLSEPSLDDYYEGDIDSLPPREEI